MKMNAVRFYAPEDIRYEQTEIKMPKAGEVRVKIEAALTCGTDLKTYRRGHPVLIKHTPSGFGHEFAGIIDSVGKMSKIFSPVIGLLLQIPLLAGNVISADAASIIFVKIWNF